MRRLGHLASLMTLLALAACGPDAVAPGNGETTNAKALQTPSTAPAQNCVADPAVVTADLTILMGVLTPNNQSAQSKWTYVKLLMSYNNPDSTAKAQAYAQNPLISFIQLKYSQASTATQNSTIIDSQGNTTTVSALLNKVIAGITCFVTAAFDIPKSNTGVALVNADGTGGAFFPPDFCDISCGGINVTIEDVAVCTAPGVPVGCVPRVGTLLDQYGKYLKITTTGGTPNFATPVVVALCVPSGTPSDVKFGLQVGHQNTGDPNPSGFSVLDKPAAIPFQLSSLLVCPDVGASRETAPKTMLARWMHRVADLLLPEKASANMYFLGLGIGGTTTKFSPFTLVSPTVSAVGGTGGTKTSFAPAMAPSLTTLANGNLQDSINVVQTTNLPKVLVKTKQGTAIPGATVTFTAQNPVTAPYSGTPSTAKVCDPTGTFVTTTDALGYATLDCLNFGTTLGYKDLAATINPATAPGLSEDGGINNVTVAACDVAPTPTTPGTCATPTATTTLHWLVTTVTGPPANLTLPTPPGATSAKLGDKLSLQPIGKLTDASNNPISGLVVTVSLTAGGGTLGCYGGGAVCLSATTAANGSATFDNLVITGTVAGVPQTLTFVSGTLTVGATVTPTVGDATKLIVETAPAAGQLGKALTTQPTVKVTDTWDNPVAGATVMVGVTGGGTLGCVLPATGCTTAPVTGANGTTTFANLTITGPVAGVEQTLTFTSGTLTKDAKVTPTVGDATNLTIETAPVAGQLGKALTTQPTVKVTDAWTNPIAGASVTAALTAGGGTLGCVSPATGCTTAPATGALGTSTFSALTVTGTVAGVVQTLTFSSAGTTAQTATVTPSAGDPSLITATNPAGGTYATPFAPFAAASPSPEVRVTDAWSNPVAAPVYWKLTSTLTGSVVSTPTTSAAGTGLSSTSWTLGDGNIGLNGYLNSGYTGATAAFTAVTTTGLSLAACTASGTTKKTDLATYSSTVSGYRGYFSILSSGQGMVRSVEVNMSVTGQSSGAGNYVTTLTAFRKNADGTKGAQIATFKPSTSDQTLQLPGNNGSPTKVVFALNPQSTGVVIPPEMMIFELAITAPSSRTFQIWYNTRTTAGTPCATSKLYQPGAVTNSATFNFGTTTQFLAGQQLKVTN